MNEAPGDETILLLAEAPSLFEPVSAGERLVRRDEYVLFLGTTDHAAYNTVQRPRLPCEVGSTVEEVRAVAGGHGRTAVTWEVSSSATPADVERRLRELGMEPASPPSAVIAALREPPPAPPGITVTRVETVEDFKRFVTITHEVFGIADRLGAELERIDRSGAADLAETRFMRYLAWVAGEPVAAATAAFTDAGAILHSGSTLERARGRGAYRALVAARWEDAVRRGTPVAVTRSGPMSRPILKRAGFRELGEIAFLVDRFG